MDDILVTYQGQPIVPAPKISYSTEMSNANDLVVGYNHKITLNGYCIGSKFATPTGTYALNDALLLKNIFNSNGGTLKIRYRNRFGQENDILRAVDTKVLSINLQESSNNWSKYIPYTIELEANHIHLSAEQNPDVETGIEDFVISTKLQSDDIVDLTAFKLKSFNENVSFNIEDDIFDQVEISDLNSIRKLFINNNYFMFNYTLSAVGKHDITNINGVKTTMPAWESAKRFVHTRLAIQLDRLITKTFLKSNDYQLLNDIHGHYTGFSLINEVDFALFNEVINFNVSESDGSFDAEYSVMVKRKCLNDGNYINIGCSDNTLHTITKKVDRKFNATEEMTQILGEGADPLGYTEITISIDGEIRGLVPGVGITSQGAVLLDRLPQAGGTGSFLTLGNQNKFSKLYYAQELLNSIMTFGTKKDEYFDFVPEFKEALGVNSINLEVDVEGDQAHLVKSLRPSSISVTKNPIEGVISYSVIYDNKYNCDKTNHFAIDISVENPTPVIAEFIIPNNNGKAGLNGQILRDEDGNPLCPGHTVIQQLGTKTAKKINVTLKGNTGLDFKNCCLGNGGGQQADPNDLITLDNPNWDLLNLDYFKLDEFIIPEGLVIPEFGPNYILTQKQKKISFPKGDFTITLAYTLATVCSVDQGLEPEGTD
jgi:hypothetical protein